MGIDPSDLRDNALRRMEPGEKQRLGKAGIITYPEALAKQEAREEKELQRLIGELLRLHGVIANRSRMNKKKTDLPGWPDFCMSLNGAAVAIEVKVPDRKLDPEQLKVREKMIAAPNNWNYFVAYSVADVVEILRKFKAIE